MQGFILKRAVVAIGHAIHVEAHDFRALPRTPQRNGLATVDTYDALSATGSPRNLYVLWHMNQAGNALVAKLVALQLS